MPSYQNIGHHCESLSHLEEDCGSMVHMVTNLMKKLCKNFGLIEKIIQDYRQTF